ncbi:MAG: stage II sporulation protein R [Bacillota bacterium]
MKLKLSAIVFLIFLSLSLNQPLIADEVEKDIIRLHIIANSDSPEDQNLKLEIRDLVLREMAELKELKNINQVSSYINKNSRAQKKHIEKYIENKGFNYKVKIELGKSRFPARRYSNSLVLPAGEYMALKIIIGEGKGGNWWCVLYPPICHGDWVKKVEKSLVLDEKTVPTLNSKISKEKSNEPLGAPKRIWHNFLQLFSGVWRII